MKQSFALKCLSLGLMALLACSSCKTNEEPAESEDSKLETDLKEFIPDHAIYSTKPAAKLTSKTIVLIHGMYMSSESWDAWKAYFEGNGYKVYAPGWPLRDKTVAELRSQHPDSKLARLKLEDVVAHYRSFLKELDEKPILIGHSMGGLVVQLLLQEKLGSAGVVLDSAPPKGVVPFEVDFWKSNWPALSPFGNPDESLLLTPEQFQFGFTEGCMSDEAGKELFQKYLVPESRAIGMGPTTLAALVDYDEKTQPLLIIAGKEDKTIPPRLNYGNFRKYRKANSLTEFQLFTRRCHSIAIQEDWREVADYVKAWLSNL